MPARVLHDGATVRGRRERNDDGLLALPDSGLFAVADGMGGYAGGDVASQTALSSIESYCEQIGTTCAELHPESTEADLRQAKERLALAIHIADREVRRRAVGPLAKMGTTVACLGVGDGYAVMGHVGDSRIYRLREGELVALTRDHSLHNKMQSAGLAGLAKNRGFRLSSVITQALGQGPAVKPDIRVEKTLPGDRFLLCSDGLTDVLDEPSIAWLLTRRADTANGFVEAAFEAGSTDNITALVVTLAS